MANLGWFGFFLLYMVLIGGGFPWGWGDGLEYTLLYIFNELTSRQVDELTSWLLGLRVNEETSWRVDW